MVDRSKPMSNSQSPIEDTAQEDLNSNWQEPNRIDLAEQVSSVSTPFRHQQPSIRRDMQRLSYPPMDSLPVQIPKEATWLLNPIDGQFGAMPVDQLLREIVPQPVRFIPTVRRPVLTNIEFPKGTSLIDAISIVCAATDLHWEVGAEQTLTISPTKTKTYLLQAQPGQTASSLTVNALDGANRSEEGDGTSMSYSSNPYEQEIRPLIEQLIQSDQAEDIPAHMSLLPAANSLVVTARPSTHQQIGDILDNYNDRIGHAVRIYIAMYEVTSSKSQSIGSKLEALKGSSNLGFSARSLNSVGEFQFQVDRLSSPWYGTTMLLDWLDQHGEARIALQDQIEVRNNQVASTSETRTFQYLATLTREQDQLGRERVSVDHDELKTGWSLGIQPTIGLDEVTLRLSFARRALVEERPYEFGSTSGTTFVTDDFTRTMSITLPTGEARLITSLSSRNHRQNKQRFLGIPISRVWDRRRTESLLWIRVELI